MIENYTKFRKKLRKMHLKNVVSDKSIKIGLKVIKRLIVNKNE